MSNLLMHHCQQDIIIDSRWQLDLLPWLCILGNSPQSAVPTSETSAEERRKETEKGGDLHQAEPARTWCLFYKDGIVLRSSAWLY